MGRIITSKKGELTTQQLVVIIILVASFAILIFFIARLGFSDISNQQICHNSVVLVGKENFLIKVGKRFTSGDSSLDCKTNDLCITGGNSCQKINPDKKVKVSNSDEVYKTIADDLATCWWMFGEGQLDYGEGCAICNIIEFSDDAPIDTKIPLSQVYNKIVSLKYSDTQTYNDYIYSGSLGFSLQNNPLFDVNLFNSNLEKNEPYYIITKGKFPPVLIKQSDFLDLNSKNSVCGNILTSP